MRCWILVRVCCFLVVLGALCALPSLAAAKVQFIDVTAASGIHFRHQNGAEVRVSSGDLTQVDVVRTGSSYLCQSALRPFFGLGDRTRIDQVEILWPSGKVQHLRDVAVDQLLTVYEFDAGLTE